MKSVRFIGNAKVKVVDVDTPVPAADEVLIKIRLSAICGSDMHAYHSPQPTDMPIGHEMIGDVVKTSAGGRLKIGDRVGVNVIKGCGECHYCRNDDTLFCKDIGMIMGGHSEYIAAPERNCIRIPDDIPDAAAILMAADTMGVSFNANKKLGVQPGEWVLVTGVGPVGLGAVVLFAHFGANVIAVDKNLYRLELARRLGAAETINVADGETLERVKEASGEYPISVAAECGGNEATLNLCLDAVGPQGSVGLCGEQSSAQIQPSNQFIRKELSMFGAWYFRMADPPELFKLYRDGMSVEPVITHRFPLEKADEAHRQFAGGQTGKVILTR